MTAVLWELSVLASRWRNRLGYLLFAPLVYRNWWSMLLPKLGVSVVLELRNGPRYLVRPQKTDLAVVNEAAILNPYLGPGYLTLLEDAIVVDVGANIGDFTIQAARLCPRGRVIAVEPISEHLRMIAVQTLLNGIENVTCVHVALGNRDGEIDIHIDGSESSAYRSGWRTERVPLTTLSRLMQELESIASPY
jgi:FkbM family methyltransferase